MDLSISYQKVPNTCLRHCVSGIKFWEIQWIYFTVFRTLYRLIININSWQCSYWTFSLIWVYYVHIVLVSFQSVMDEGVLFLFLMGLFLYPNRGSKKRYKVSLSPPLREHLWFWDDDTDNQSSPVNRQILTGDSFIRSFTPQAVFVHEDWTVENIQIEAVKSEAPKLRLSNTERHEWFWLEEKLWKHQAAL